MSDKRVKGEIINCNLLTLGIPGLVLIGRTTYSAAQPPLALHKHSGILEICYVSRGERIFTAGGIPFL